MTGSTRNYTHQPVGRPGLDPGTLGIESRALIVQRVLLDPSSLVELGGDSSGPVQTGTRPCIPVATQ
jgi:hypothetical protein